MTDLECPVRVLLCRHGEARYEHPTVLADSGGFLTEKGAEQARALARELRDERVALVVTSPLRSAMETARILADRLEVPMRVVDGLREFSIGDLDGRMVGPDVAAVFDRWLGGDLAASCPGGESGESVVARLRSALGELADEHRGENVVAVSHGGTITLAAYYLARARELAGVRGPLLPNCAVVTLEGDSAGWRMTSPWPGVARHAGE